MYTIEHRVPISVCVCLNHSISLNYIHTEHFQKFSTLLCPPSSQRLTLVLNCRLRALNFSRKY